ncbi:hypothetical protein CSP5_1420 [Cuniculiplasma divulgatum]|jgi:hypothetical protein|uniref:Uncharacterized protein n=1 Tax=Cuniculiplasma divulgatum TaxID=1673428 RepID=A0A1N5VLQ2_9ARCH|nr:MAG: hypothetical protein AMDU5_GPLC00003G0046 [Thermoplasmatales archaeon Gpl]SIM73679.1 hypothetical protein CSP5_1420 [Cuniculiplasma divulgatum]
MKQKMTAVITVAIMPPSTKDESTDLLNSKRAAGANAIK